MKLGKWMSEEKMAIVLEGLKGQKTVAEICREHQISQTLFYRWRRLRVNPLLKMRLQN